MKMDIRKQKKSVMKVYNDSRIPTGLGKPSYMDVFEDGYRDGFDAGYRFGKAGCDTGCTEAYNSGLETGYASGVTVGYDSGYTDGVATCDDCSEVYAVGYADGYAAGQNDCEGCEGAYHNGFQDGYESGYTDGAATCEDCSGLYDSGYTDGYQSGYTRGYNTGFEDGEATCEDCSGLYDSGYTDGYQSGWTNGYASGYTDGSNGESPVPPSPITGTCYVTAVYKPVIDSYTGRIKQTRILNNTNYISKIVFEDGTEISPVTGYTFSDTDEKYAYFVLDNNKWVTQQFRNTDMIRAIAPSCPSYSGGEGAFQSNSKLVSAVVEEGLTTLPSSMFLGCTSLTSVVLPSTLSNLSLCTELFASCPLTSITITATTAPTLNNLTFDSLDITAPTGTLYYPTGSDYSSWLAKLPSGWVGQEI